MDRPARIAAVVAVTAVLMTTAGFGVTAIQRAAFPDASPPAVSAAGPALLGGASPDVAAVASVLGPIADTPLPAIPQINQDLTPVTPPVTVAAGTEDSASAEHEHGQESEDHDDYDDYEGDEGDD